MDKFILFTNRYEHNNYSPFQNLRIPLYDNGNSDTESQAFVSFAESSYSLEDEKEFELLFIADVHYENNGSNIKEVIRKFSKNIDNTFVILHANPCNTQLKEQHKKIIKSVLGEGFNNFKEQSHIEGDVYYEEIIEIAKSIKNKNENSYQHALRKIKDRFPDLTLEAKLELLHACFTLEGAKNIVDSGFPQNLKQEKEKFWNKKLVELNPSLFNKGNNDKEKYSVYKEWTVEEIVKALSGNNATNKKIEFTDNFDPDYLNVLTLLKECLIFDNGDIEQQLIHNIPKLIPTKPSDDPLKLIERIRDVLVPENRTELRNAFESYLALSNNPEKAILKLSNLIWRERNEKN